MKWKSKYVRFEVPGAFGTDILEFAVTAKRAPAPAPPPSEDGDDAPAAVPQRVDGIIGFRSLATKVNFVYPFQTPVPDIDAQRERVEAVRTALGYDTYECGGLPQ